MSIAARIDDTLTAHRWTPRLDQGGSAADGAGTGRVDLRRVGRKTTITRLRACSPLKLLAPRRERQSACGQFRHDERSAAHDRFPAGAGQ